MCSSLKGSSKVSQKVNERNLNNVFYLQVYMASALGHRQVQSKRIVFFSILFMTLLGLHGGRLVLCCCMQAISSCSKQGLLFLCSLRASVVVVHELSCSVPCGIKPMYPGLASGFLTTAPPGKSLEYSFVILFGNSEVMLKKNGNLYEFLETLDF